MVEVAESGDKRYLLFMVSGKPHFHFSLLKRERLWIFPLPASARGLGLALSFSDDMKSQDSLKADCSA